MYSVVVKSYLLVGFGWGGGKETQSYKPEGF